VCDAEVLFLLRESCKSRDEQCSGGPAEDGGGVEPVPGGVAPTAVAIGLPVLGLVQVEYWHDGIKG
jgi:hypothetical protein